MFRKRKKNTYQIQTSTWWVWIAILGIVTLVIVAIGGWIQFHRDSVWTGRSRINLVIVNPQQSSQLQIFSFQPSVNVAQTNQVVIVNLSGEIKLRLTRGYQDYLASALYGLAVQEENMNILTDTLTYELGIPIDGYIANSKSKIADFKNKKAIVNNLHLEIRSWLHRGIQSNLSWGDRAKIWWQTRQLNSEKITYLDFSQGNWAKQKQEVDGQSIIWFDKNTIDARLPELFSDAQIRQESLTVRVVNTTGTNGLSSQISRIINGMGMRVTEVSNSKKRINQCEIQTTLKVRKSQSTKRLMQIFHCKLSEINLSDLRTDIELRVGFKQVEVWKGK